jgi:hypothetical protein
MKPVKSLIIEALKFSIFKTDFKSSPLKFEDAIMVINRLDSNTILLTGHY